jgi:hypothetical protein
LVVLFTSDCPARRSGLERSSFCLENENRVWYTHSLVRVHVDRPRISQALCDKARVSCLRFDGGMWWRCSVRGRERSLHERTRSHSKTDGQSSKEECYLKKMWLVFRRNGVFYKTSRARMSKPPTKKKKTFSIRVKTLETPFVNSLRFEKCACLGVFRPT